MTDREMQEILRILTDWANKHNIPLSMTDELDDMLAQFILKENKKLFQDYWKQVASIDPGMIN